MRIAVRLTVAVGLALVFSTNVCLGQITIYHNDFEQMVGPEWSHTSTAMTPSGRQFLGHFGNDQVTLTLMNLPQHERVSLSFQLFVINSWDGNRTDAGGDNCGSGFVSLGPDEWRVDVIGGSTLLYTTFENNEPENHVQAYPGTYPGVDFPSRFGASENDTLGYGQDAVYSFPNFFHNFTFDHSGNTLTLQFTGGPHLQCLADESWGLDNICVDLINVNAAPVITCAAPVILWSPDHELVDASSTFTVADPEGENPLVTVRVFSDEPEVPETGDGTGRHAPDFKDELSTGRGLLVRSERRGSEDGRFYVAVITADDQVGGITTDACILAVCPHDQNQQSLDDVLGQAAAAAANIKLAIQTQGLLPPIGLHEHGLSEPLGPKQ